MFLGKSTPPEKRGLHRRILAAPCKRPMIDPFSKTASIMYSEQVG